MSALLYPALLFEMAAVVALLLLVFAAPRRTARLLEELETRLALLPLSLGRQLLIVALAAIAFRAALLPWLGPPTPLIHDEHSLLLQARTLLEGRLANPSHPLWPYFQTFHVNQTPAYASVYFIGRALPLVLGLLLADIPWLGVWVCFVLLAMGMVWMLRAFVGPRTALAGGLLVVLRLGGGSYWINSYWGGALTALGAVLVLGAMVRLLKEPRWRDGLLLGLGALIMMITRPYEGALTCAALGLFALPRLLSSGGAQIGRTALRGGVPLLVCVALGAGATLAYNKATTGDLMLTPYEVNRSTYAIAPAFMLSGPVKHYENAERVPSHFTRFYVNEARDYNDAHRSLAGLGAALARKSMILWIFYIGPALTIPFLAGLYAIRRNYLVIGTLGLLYLGYLPTSWDLPHYVSPALPFVMVIVMHGFTAMRDWTKRPNSGGAALSRGSYLLTGAPTLLMVVHLSSGWPALPNDSWHQPCCAIAQSSPHSEVVERLTSLPGRDLVLVTDNEASPIHNELVWNGPDIDAEPIVFAHSFDPEADRRLIDYFGERRIWRFNWVDDGYALSQLRDENPPMATR